ncbi:pentapeptide repeat-containing protein [Rothia sp. 27098_8_29]|uniref:pentapeptide repeat-containing protein n=1 Tax=Rothia sp. 27098_8_29 TaxID=3003676 RepID=UPI00352F2AFC
MHLAPSTAWVWLIACAVVILFFPLAAQFGNLKGKLSSFRTWVWAIALLGIVTAGFMPFTFGTDIANFEVQPFIFFITGTLLGVLFLGEFHRMNAQKKLKHPQRVHAERRTRYSKAVEQLAYPNPAVRASAISTLAGLVDEWLADEQLSVEARQKEGQVIVNALCAYVRSPFSRAFKAEAFDSDTPPANYAGDFATDLAAFRGEQDVRRSVFVEMSKRSSTLAENEKGEVAVVPGAWSGFEFDFSRAVVFYPLDGLTLENANFSAARFCNGSDFSGAAFVGTVDFSRATFGGIAGFGDATFAGEGNFSHATFTRSANFGGASFVQSAYFDGVKFMQNAHFSGVKFTQDTNFSGASFMGVADFCDVSFVKSPPVFAIEDADSGEMCRARFAALSAGSESAGQEAHNFTMYEDSQPIPLGTAILNGVGYRIPVGAVLFDPASWDARQKEYTRMSEPAQ